MSYPRRGDIWWVDWNPYRGSEQAGFRPALVVQNDVVNQHGATTIVAALTIRLRPMPTHVRLGAVEGGLPRESMVKLEQLMTVDKTRLAQRKGRLSPAKMAEVDEAIRISLGLAGV